MMRHTMMAQTMSKIYESRIYETLNRQIGVAVAAIKQEMAYRFDFITATLGALLTMSLVYYLWTAIYRSAATMPLSYQALITYVCLGQAFSPARPGQRRVLAWIGYRIRSGDVLMDLLRPTDYQLHAFSDTLGWYLMETVFVSLPSYLLAMSCQCQGARSCSMKNPCQNTRLSPSSY